jgi:hypothetical protein
MKKELIKKSGLWIGSQISQAVIIFSLSKIPKLKMNMETTVKLIILSFIIISILWFLYWGLKWVYDSIMMLNVKFKYLSVKLKYYDIMLTKFKDINKSHSCLVFQEDFDVFTKEDHVLLNKYLNELKNLKIIMKGKNKVDGMFL